jgi:glucose-1-phosphate cytidylyltransferase
MKVVILAGGFGTRLSEYTKTIPKPMIKIAGLPILVHIMKHYAKFGFNEFYIALGYKGNVVKNYFKKKKFNWKINLINTGKNTMTGGRLKRLKKYLRGESFFLTYGDGLSDINIVKLLKFHKKNKKLVTVTAVRPPARFGALKLKGNFVSYFKEKSKMDEGWINGGFFVVNYNFLNFIKNDKTYLEREPLEKVVKLSELSAYRHEGFWQCIDNMRDLVSINKKIKEKKFQF